MSRIVFNIAFTSKAPPEKLSGKARVEYEAERKFFNLTAEYNYFTYILNEKKVAKNKDAASYYTRGKQYVNEDITGLFNDKGLISKEDMEKMKAKLAATGSNIWHGFISFDEETSKGFTAEEQAIKFLKQSFNSFIARSHLRRDNVELFAALHTDTKHHHHIHFSFFEKEPHRNKNGELAYTHRGSFDKANIDNYLISANMYVSDNKYEYYTARDRAMEKLELIRAAGVAAREHELRAMLSALSAKLPSGGRLSYASKNMTELRPEIDAVANALVQSNPEAYEAHSEVMRQLAIREQEAVEIARDNRVAYVRNRRLNKKDIMDVMAVANGKDLQNKRIPLEFTDAAGIDTGKIDYIERLRYDYRTRLGNQVIGLIKDMGADYRAMRRTRVNDLQLKIDSKRRRSGATAVLHGFVRALGEVQRGIQADFTKRMHAIERENEREIAAGRNA
ncbi:MAG: relaxase MobL [Clostridiales bacterium]|jgi:hypothetical protein|nr:relaxase MobL [Clostridiales bacterium]